MRTLLAAAAATLLVSATALANFGDVHVPSFGEPGYGSTGGTYQPGYSQRGARDASAATGGFQSFSDISVQHNYALVQTAIVNIAKQYPQNATVFTLGQSGTGDAILGLKIGNGPVHNMIVSIHHGNEYGAAEVALSAAADLASNPIPNQTVFVIPVLNVSGFNADRREETVTGSITQDANRDYPGPCATSGPFKLKSTKALADFIGQQNIVASATLHTFMPGVLYPWGISTRDTSTPYDSQFISLANTATSVSHYQVGNSTDALYPADGAYEDYAFWQYGIWSLLFEVGTTHTPGKAQLDELDRVNVPGLRAMMMAAPTERAPDHAFHGACETRMRMLDLHNE